MIHLQRALCICLLSFLTTLECFNQTLPPEVPTYTYARSGPVSPGLLMVGATPMTATAPKPSTLLMIDTAGTLVFYMKRNAETAPPYPNRRLLDFKLDPDGWMRFFDLEPGTSGSYLRMDSTMAVKQVANCGLGIPLDGHDFVVTPDGHRHLFCEFDTLMDLSGLTTTSGAAGLNPGTVRVQLVVEQDASGAPLWIWNPLYFLSIAEMNLAYFSDSSLLDLTHYNSMDVDSAGNYLLSSRHLDQLQYVAKDSGNFIWRIGGMMNDFTLIGDSVWFSGQHDARFQPGDRISLFDNATTTPSGVARGIEYLLDTNAMTIAQSWVKTNPWGLTSQFIGNHQHLPDGHRLIGWGGILPWTTSLTAHEFLPSHEPVMSFDLSPGWISYRVMKYELPWTLHRPTISCNPDSLLLVAEAGWDHYYWSTGDSSSTIAIADTGRYQVWGDYGDGRVSSEIFIVKDLFNPCASIGLAQPSSPGALIAFPNPSSGTVVVRSTGALPLESVLVHDLLGRELHNESVSGHQVDLDLSHLGAGNYWISAFTRDGQMLRSRLVISR